MNLARNAAAFSATGGQSVVAPSRPPNFSAPSREAHDSETTESRSTLATRIPRRNDVPKASTDGIRYPAWWPCKRVRPPQTGLTVGLMGHTPIRQVELGRVGDLPQKRSTRVTQIRLNGRGGMTAKGNADTAVPFQRLQPALTRAPRDPSDRSEHHTGEEAQRLQGARTRVGKPSTDIGRSFPLSDDADFNSDLSEVTGAARVDITIGRGGQVQGTQRGISETNQTAEYQPQDTLKYRERLKERVPNR